MCLFGATLPALAVAQQPEPLVAEATIWGENDEGSSGHAYLPATIQGKAVTLLVDLENNGTLQLSAGALSRVGVTLPAGSTQLDSLTMGKFVDRQIPLELAPAPDWAEAAPPNFAPVVGYAGTEFVKRYDALYDFPNMRLRLYQGPSQSAKASAAWLPPGTKPSDCGKMIRIPPPNAGTFTAVEMQINGHPVTGVLEMGPYRPKMNEFALKALTATTDGPKIHTTDPTPIYGDHTLIGNVDQLEMTTGSHMFGAWDTEVLLEVDVQQFLKPNTPVMLMNLSMLRAVTVFNSMSSNQVCFSTP